MSFGTDVTHTPEPIGDRLPDFSAAKPVCKDFQRLEDSVSEINNRLGIVEKAVFPPTSWQKLDTAHSKYDPE